jgi:hypothetical protein
MAVVEVDKSAGKGKVECKNSLVGDDVRMMETFEETDLIWHQ